MESEDKKRKERVLVNGEGEIRGGTGKRRNQITVTSKRGRGNKERLASERNCPNQRSGKG